MSAVSNANQSMSFTFRMIIPQESSLEVYDDNHQRLDRHAADDDDADADADDDADDNADADAGDDADADDDD